MKALSIGIVPLTDSAPLVVAREFGFFERHGLSVELSCEASWANVRDKLATGALDGAQMLAAMPLAAHLGVDPLASRVVVAASLDLNGNAITVSRALFHRMIDIDGEAAFDPSRSGQAIARVIAADRHCAAGPLRLGIVFPVSTHAYELRYWLASAGIDPERDVRLVVVPPPRMVECLAAGEIDGYCVGEPWSSLAVDRGVGVIVTTKLHIWSNSPEKVLAVRPEFAEQERGALQALVRGLIEASAWTDRAENRIEVARLLADSGYVRAPFATLARSLTGDVRWAPEARTLELPDFHVFHRYAANFPWVSHAAWLITQMLRWGQVTEPIDVLAAARAVYRPDLYRTAALDLGIPCPVVDTKTEGQHSSRWLLDQATTPITMGPDRFVDGRSFSPDAIVKYLAETRIAHRRADLDQLARRNP